MARRASISMVVAAGAALAGSMTAAQEHPEEDDARRGRIEKCTYVSRIDGATIEYALWYPPEYDDSVAWPLIVFLHGSGEGGDWTAPTRPQAGIPVRTVWSDLPFLAVSPLMRGTWSINGPAALDVLDTVADVQSRANVDPNRIHLTGISLGAFAGWSIAAHNPDRFASLSLFAGGGDPELAGNLRHLPTWVFQGADDRSVPPGETQRMVDAMRSLELPVRYSLMPGVGHNCWVEPYAGRSLYQWMNAHARVTEPPRITYQTRSLRHHRAYWAQIEGMLDPAQPAKIDVLAPDGVHIYVHAENVAELTLRPPPSIIGPGTVPTFFVNNQPFEATAVPGGWRLPLKSGPPSPLRKRHGLSGPIQDVFWDAFVIVRAVHEDPQVTELWAQAARQAFQWRETLTYETFRFISADQITSDVIQSSNLIYFGNPGDDDVLAQAAARLPLGFAQGGLWVGGQPASKDIVGLIVIYPNPLNPERYLVLCSGHPAAVAGLAAVILRPPYLSPTPIEDLVVVTRSGALPLQQAASDSSSRDAWMAPMIPPRGALFDANWQIPADVIRRLIQPEPAPPASTTQPATP